MAGSGTTIVTARMRGHNAIGFDSDPLAVLLSSTWASSIDTDEITEKGRGILDRARSLAGPEFPRDCDDDTREFIRYWFDPVNRVQLTALAQVIGRLRDKSIRNVMWCAFSRMIITKKVGVSLAMDVSHSRPHKKFKSAPVQAFEQFGKSLALLAKAAPFKVDSEEHPPAAVLQGDARELPLDANSIDAVVTSPPYLNAIDYLRGHKLSLVWMGYDIAQIRALRSGNIGTEVGSRDCDDTAIESAMDQMCSVNNLSTRNRAMLRRYVQDTRSILTEIHRVLRPLGKAVLVVGDCNIREVFIQNSRGIEILGVSAGLSLQNVRKRPIPENRRYLPPPTTSGAGVHLQKRMREEVILTFQKPRHQ